MPNLRMFLTFLAVVLVVMGGVHGYVYDRLVLAPSVPAPWSVALAVLFGLGTVSMPLAFLASRRLSRAVARFVVVPIYVWLGFIFETFVLVAAGDLVWVVAGVSVRLAGAGPLFTDPVTELEARRLVAGIIVGITGCATLIAVWWGLRPPVVRRIEVSLPGLARPWEGFTIAQLTDLHLDLVHGGAWLSTIVDRTNDLAPDLIAITGDLAEGSVSQYGDDATVLRQLRAPRGVYFVTGNHEYFHDLEGWLSFLSDLGIRVLRNERVTITGNGAAVSPGEESAMGAGEAGTGPPGDSIGFYLAGVDDHQGAGLATGHGPDLPAALEGRNPDVPVVLLAHQPQIVDEARRAGVGLVLSGHTHGGQIWPFSYLVYLQQPFVKGLNGKGATTVYVSSGTGFWGPPMRLGTTAEITLITLRSKRRPSA